ncbi:MAG: BspA family leucine-rich repeat surface protein, partial [Bacteroidota bacterium]
MKKVHYLFALLMTLLAIGGANGQAFITTWKTDNQGTSGDNEISIPTTGSGYNYTVDWGDGNSDTGVTGNITHTYASAGTYTVTIAGDFPRIYFNKGGDRLKILTIEQWGNISWTSMEASFWGCNNLTIPATDAPDLTGATSMFLMLAETSSFNEPVDHWDVSTITDMRSMLANCPLFNQSLSSWDVSNVTNIAGLFLNATTFNQDISNWNVSSVTVMQNTFSGATSFNQNLNVWSVGNVTNMTNMFSNSGLTKSNYDKILDGWSQLTLQNNVSLGATGVEYCNSTAARQSIIDTYNWTITDEGENCLPFVTTWKTDNTGTSGDTEITIPTTGTGYNYTVDWGDGNSDMNVAGDITHTYSSAGTYTVSISGDFPRIYFNNGGDKEKILTVEQWGSIAWSDMSLAFRGCSNLDINATDAPDLSGVTNLAAMFSACTNLSADLNHWDVSNVTSMLNMFFGAASFNQSLNAWNVSNVTNMQGMFHGASIFNGDITSWNTANVTNMNSTFRDASAFNQNISGWDVSSVTNMESMFEFARDFLQPIGSWDVSAVTNMESMFEQDIFFNEDLSSWNVGNVTNFERMFLSARAFDQPIGGWDVSSGTNFSFMFLGADEFNSDITSWNVSSATHMTSMFANNTAFNQDLSSWDISNLSFAASMFNGSGL